MAHRSRLSGCWAGMRIGTRQRGIAGETCVTLTHLVVLQRPGTIAALDTTMREFTAAHRADVARLRERPAGCVVSSRRRC